MIKAEEVVRMSEFAASWSEVQVAWGSPNLWLASDAGAVLWETLPFVGRAHINSGGSCQNYTAGEQPYLGSSFHS